MNIGFIKPLEKSESRWIVGVKTDDEQAAIIRQILSLLNKISLDKFDQLSKQCVDIIATCPVVSMLREVIKIIFDKALAEKYFANMYARLCMTLGHDLPKFQELIIESGEEKLQETTFKRILLNQCQDEFEKGTATMDVTSETPGEHELLVMQQKMRMLGNIKFIGELYKQKMIGERIMHMCVTHLLREHVPTEEDLQAVCDLLTTIGKKLDHDMAKQHNQMYFDRLVFLSTNNTLASRCRFMCLDLLELRKNRWEPRTKKNEGAQTKEEVHRENAREKGGGGGGGRNDVRHVLKRPNAKSGPQDARGGKPAAAAPKVDRYAKTTGQASKPLSSSDTQQGAAPTADRKDGGSDKPENRDRDRDRDRDKSRDRDRCTHRHTHT
jgi:translation initiation factor 4G